MKYVQVKKSGKVLHLLPSNATTTLCGYPGPFKTQLVERHVCFRCLTTADRIGIIVNDRPA